MKKKKAGFSFSKWLGLSAALLLIPSLLLNVFLLWKGRNFGHGKRVGLVIDGDTFELVDGERIRLRNVDAPAFEFCYGPEAKEKLGSLISMKEVVLKERVIGQQNRGLYLVYANGLLVNLAMLEGGFGRYHHDNSSQAEILKEAGDRAKKANLGVYGPDCYQTQNLAQPECNIKGNIDKNKYEDNRKYYYPGCPQYNFTIVEKDLGEAWFCSEAEAEAAGFIKAKNCP